MAKSFKPTVSYINENGKNISLTLPKYSEVKKRMNAFMKDSFDEYITVYRHRRGEWGEWYEKWAKTGKKCKIIEQGWQ
jgi:hypothetical protein